MEKTAHSGIPEGADLSWIGFTDPIPPWRASLGTRTKLGHGLIIVLEMAWVRQNGEFSLIKSVISNHLYYVHMAIEVSV